VRPVALSLAMTIAIGVVHTAAAFVLFLVDLFVLIPVKFVWRRVR
jgi:Na+-translocating ferredoxin:NAD+ oxidoreductase RnfA subunit